MKFSKLRKHKKKLSEGIRIIKGELKRFSFSLCNVSFSYDFLLDFAFAETF